MIKMIKNYIYYNYLQDGGLTPMPEPRHKPMYYFQREEVFAEGAERSCILGVEHNASLPLMVRTRNVVYIPV